MHREGPTGHGSGRQLPLHESREPIREQRHLPPRDPRIHRDIRYSDTRCDPSDEFEEGLPPPRNYRPADFGLCSDVREEQEGTMDSYDEEVEDDYTPPHETHRSMMYDRSFPRRSAPQQSSLDQEYRHSAPNRQPLNV